MRQDSLSPPIRLLALCVMALGACAAPVAVSPTAAPTEPATATALPPTVADTPESTQAGAGNAPVPATSVALGGPAGLAFDADGNLYIAECAMFSGSSGPPVYKIDTLRLLTTFAGPSFSGVLEDGGPALNGGIACAAGLAFGPDGNLYIADNWNNRIRRIDRNGIISTVAGSGAKWDGTGPLAPPGGFGGDSGPATAALLWWPADVAFDPGGNLYINDAGNSRIRKVDKQGIITTVAGNGTIGFSGDRGLATAAQLAQYPSGNGGPTGIACDADGNLYVADSGNNRVRKIDRQGIITTIAGTGGPVVSGDGGPATAAALASPTGLAFDAEGKLYIATSDNRIRKIDQLGIITTVVGGRP